MTITAKPPARLLMCPPDFYAVEYEINPWMSLNRPADHARATQQWAELYRVLTQEIGAEIELMTPVKGLPDLVFTANAGLAWDRLFVRSNFRYKEREPEAPVYAAWFAQHGYQVVYLHNDYSFEGEGDILPFGGYLFAGYRFRSDIRAHNFIGELLSRRVLSLELVDPFYYHLDTCFCPLDNKSALYYPAAFDSYGLKVIREYIPDPVAVTSQDAQRFGCNSIVIGQNVVMNAGCHQLARELEEKGFRVFSIDLSEYIKSGGSAKCLVLFLSRPSDSPELGK